jgi:hypothetical protein
MHNAARCFADYFVAMVGGQFQLTLKICWRWKAPFASPLATLALDWGEVA